MTKDELNKIAETWGGVTKGYARLTFEEAKRDMDLLMAEVRKVDELKYRIAELEAHIKKRNADMQAFANEVGRLASEKYSDWMQSK